MFGIDSWEFLVIGVVALVVIGPKDLPRVMRVVGGWVGRGRAMTRHLRAGFDTMMREAELDEMQKQWARQNAEIMAATDPAAVGPHAFEAPPAAYAAAAAGATEAVDDAPPYPDARSTSEGTPGISHPRDRGDDRDGVEVAPAMTGPQPSAHALAAEPTPPLVPAAHP